MSDLHFCSSKGFLVAPGEWLPDEPFDYDWSIGGLMIGCNTLRCENCGEAVTSRVEGAIRKYACKCNEDGIAYGGRSVAQVVNPMTDETLPWACAGHPPLALPGRLEGVAITDEDWPSLARRVFAKQLDPPGPEKGKNLRGFFIQRLYNLLADGSALSRSVATLLEDPDPRVRVAATAFFFTNSIAPGNERPPQVLQAHPELFIGVADPDNPNLTLWDWMEETLCQRLGDDPLADQLLRQHALSPPGIDRGIFALAQKDFPWLAAHAPQVLAAAPGRWKSMLYALRRWDAMPSLARRVMDEGHASQLEVAAWAKKELDASGAESVVAALR